MVLKKAKSPRLVIKLVRLVKPNRELVNGSKLVRLEKSIESRIGKMDQIDQIGNSDFANLRMSCRSPILHAIG